MSSGIETGVLVDGRMGIVYLSRSIYWWLAGQRSSYLLVVPFSHDRGYHKCMHLTDEISS